MQRRSPKTDRATDSRHDSPEPPMPSDLAVAEFSVGEESYVVLSFRPRPLETEGLTHAERAVLAAVLAGESNAEIARKRRRSPRTVANQVASILRKLGVSSRVELARR